MGERSLRLVIDELACEGYGKCERIAPNLFKLDESGNVGVLVGGHLNPAQLQRANMAVKLCPTKAIRLAEIAQEEKGSEPFNRAV
jgi:ferredoxin